MAIISPEERKKIFCPADMKKIVEAHKKRGKVIVQASGTYDPLHYGHVQSFYFAKSLGDILVVSTNGDKSLTQVKGPGRPLVPLKFRMAMIASIAHVDYVTWFDEVTPEKLVLLLKPDIFVKGKEYEGSPRFKEAEALASYGGQAVFNPIENIYSSSQLGEMLRRYYMVTEGYDILQYVEGQEE